MMDTPKIIPSDSITLIKGVLALVTLCQKTASQQGEVIAQGGIVTQPVVGFQPNSGQILTYHQQPQVLQTYPQQVQPDAGLSVKLPPPYPGPV